jgi:hypothetical protein
LQVILAKGFAMNELAELLLENHLSLLNMPIRPTLMGRLQQFVVKSYFARGCGFCKFEKLLWALVTDEFQADASPSPVLVNRKPIKWLIPTTTNPTPYRSHARPQIHR